MREARETGRDQAFLHAIATSFPACISCPRAHLGTRFRGPFFLSLGHIAGYNECAILIHSTTYGDSKTTQIFHPLLALIASASDNQLAIYVEYLKEENKILRARIPGQVHTRREERERLLKYGKAIGQAIEA